MDYWEIIKKDEGLKLEHLQRAHDLLKRGRNYRSFDDIDEFARNDQNVLNLTNYEDWEWEAVEEYSPSRCAKRKRSKHVKKRKTSILQPKQKAKCNKKEFVGWGSKPLIDFLASVGVDASKELSQYKVTNIVMEHVEKNKLLHPKRKKMILCDQYLQSLLGRKLVNKFRVHGLLEAHFAKSLENTEKGDWCSSEEKSYRVLTHCKRKRNKNSNGNQNQGEVISRESTTAITPAIAPPPRIVAIVSENISLVYLRRSLVEELLKQTKNVEAKVIGSFVRVKSDPNNYLQQHPYQLVQVIGMRKKTTEVEAEMLLQVSNMPDDITISMLSDSDFTKEECEQLLQEMKDGLHKKPTVVQLEHKARILREDIIKHGFMKELALLNNLIDIANEKGRRRELMEYVERRDLLLQPSEQSRLIREIPEVIVEDTEHSVDFATSYERSEVGTAPCNDPSGVEVAAAACKPRYDIATTQENQLKVPSEPLLEEECCSSQIYTGKEFQRRNRDATNGGKFEVLHMPTHEDSISITVVKEKQGPEAENNMAAEQQQSAIQVIDLSDDHDEGGTIQLIDLSDDDKKIARMKSRWLEHVQAEAAEWYCMGPEGDTRGPYKMSFLKCWNEICTHPYKFKVWKIGQGRTNGIPLPDACRSVCESSVAF